MGPPAHRANLRFLSVETLRELGFRDHDGNIPADQLSLYKTVERGAATTVWCATSPALEGMGGVYCEDVDVARSVFPGHKELNGVIPWAIDLEAAERLWTLSKRLTGKRIVVTRCLPNPAVDPQEPP